MMSGVLSNTRADGASADRRGHEDAASAKTRITPRARFARRAAARWRGVLVEVAALADARDERSQVDRADCPIDDLLADLGVGRRRLEDRSDLGVQIEGHAPASHGPSVPALTRSSGGPGPSRPSSRGGSLGVNSSAHRALPDPEINPDLGPTTASECREIAAFPSRLGRFRRSRDEIPHA
jgi:hypothetical protein